MKTTAFFTRILSWLTGSRLTVDNSVVRELDLDRFLGSWYEVARFDHFFERGMSQTKANYVLRDDGNIDVINTGVKRLSLDSLAHAATCRQRPHRHPQRGQEPRLRHRQTDLGETRLTSRMEHKEGNSHMEQTEHNPQTEQITRIQQMERCLDRVSQAVMRLSAALDEYADVQDALRQLSDYYGSDAWKQDFAADSAGLLPPGLKRGVLSEDAVWNLLEDVSDLKERMANLLYG